jgi:CDP-diacylglycerol--glycerol-3-phosphate 3-phosphatidyltransferase
LSAGLPSRDDYLTQWSELHGGYDPRASRLSGPWLAMTYLLARPLARARVSPDAVTLAALVVSAVSVWPAWAGGRWALAAAVLVVLSGLLDNLDGAVALLRGRATAWGYVLDSVVDRCSDLLHLIALYAVGAPGWLCALGGALTFLQEYARARAAAGGMPEIGVVTLWERPTRVIVATMFLVGAGVHVSSAGGWAAAGASASATLGAVGTAQLLVAVRRRLR